MKYFFLGFFLAIAVELAFAKSPEEYALVFPLASKHYKGDGISSCGLSRRNNPEYREQNPGIGLKKSFDRHWAFEFGYYKNSAWGDTLYVLTKWTPIDHQWIRSGVGLGGGTGYCNKPIQLMAGTVISIDITKDFGFDIVATPPIGKQIEGVIGLQFRVSF